MGKRGGAPEKYDEWLTEEGLAKLKHIARHSVSKAAIADSMGVARSTLYKWCEQHKVISDAIKETEPVVIGKLENTLDKLCEGFIQVVNGKEVYFPPNPTAVLFALKNKDAKHYRDRREVELSGNVGISDAIAQAVSRAEAADSDT